MTRPANVNIDLVYDRDGRLDTSSLIMTLESQLEGRLKITDWYDENLAANDYPHLTSDEIRQVIPEISTGDYDDAIDRDIRRNALDDAVASAGLPRWEGDLDEEIEDENSATP
ncbi:hypothetical protein G6L37_01060 [Agrobacterium rubi]|nr:hypothetical protein [Agrobacterium rubi]NTF23981.1 hypothetical protein [Agrobacterium rubi]